MTLKVRSNVQSMNAKGTLNVLNVLSWYVRGPLKARLSRYVKCNKCMTGSFKVRLIYFDMALKISIRMHSRW